MYITLLIVLFMYFSITNVVFLIPLFYIGYLHKDKIIFALFLVLPLLVSKVRIDKIEIKEYANNIYEVYEVKNNQCYLKENFTNYIMFNCYGYIPGDVLVVRGEISTPGSSRTDSSFDYKNYLLSKNVKMIIYQDEVSKVGNKKTVNVFGYYLKEEIDRIFKEKTADYLKTLLYGESLENVIIEDISNIGINHLFAISGLHISLILSMLSKLLSMIKKDLTIILKFFCLFYIVITSYSISVTRATLMYIFSNSFDKKLNSFEVCLLAMYIQLIFKPYAFYNTGFVYSYFVTIIIILSNEVLSLEDKSKQVLYLAIYIFVFSLPLNMYFNYEISVFMILYNIIFSFIVVFFIMPLVFLTYIFPIFEELFLVFINIFEYITTFFSKVNVVITTGKIDLIELIYLYFLIISVMVSIELRTIKYNSKIVLLLLSIFFVVEIKEIDTEIAFLDMQGAESIVLINEDCVTIFDIGESYNSNNVENYLIPHLKSRGIENVDNVFLTHDDYDHYGGIFEFEDNFPISNIFVSEYSEFEYEQVVKGDVIKCGEIEFKILAPLKDIDKNNNSLVIYFEIKGVSFLFTGDIEEEVEDLLIDVYENLKVDALKVAHHGSLSSTTERFLASVDPSVAFITVDKNNSHNHPSEVVVNRIESRGIELYRTDLNSSIYLYLKGEGRYVVK